MNKTIAHLIFLAIDIAAIYLAYFVIKTYWQISQDIQAGIDRVSFQWPFGMFLILMIIPVIHLSSIFPKGSGAKSFGDIFLLAGVSSIVLVIALMNINISRNLKSNDYIYNSEDSKWMTFSMFKHYDKKK